MGPGDTENIAIRLAGADDVAAVTMLVHSAYAHYAPRIGRKPAPMLDNYADLVDAKRVHVLDVGGAVQGIIVLIPEPNAMLVDNVAVAPVKQGLGLGRAMMAFAEQAAIDAGYRAVRLYTNEAMTENIALYARLGYVRMHRAQERGLRRVYLEKRLD